MRIDLVIDNTQENECVGPDVKEFENAIAADAGVNVCNWLGVTSWTVAGARALYRKAGFKSRENGAFEAPFAARSAISFSVLLGPSFRRCARFILQGRKAAYLFDATQPWTTPEQIVKFTTEAGINILFVDHPDMIPPIQKIKPRLKVFFVAQAVNAYEYQAATEKDIDVFEFGRKMPGYHQSILKHLEAHGFSHQYKFLKTRREFLDYLARSKVVICFPRSLTAGDGIPMLTMRYFQAMASRGLIVGSCPPLLKDLFGYDPVIAADLHHPGPQIQEILQNYSSFSGLIERNYSTLIEGHTYFHRWQEIKNILTAEMGL